MSSLYGQVVIGCAGSGKSTYCEGLCQIYTSLGRKFSLVNLDAGNILCSSDTPKSVIRSPDIDIRDLVQVEAVAEETGLGPNGALLYSMDQILVDFCWLANKVLEQRQKGIRYFIFDMPGQIELFSSSTIVEDILSSLEKQCGFRLVVVNLVDSILCLDKFSYLSAKLSALAFMTRLQFPVVNVLSKLDVLRTYRDDLDLRLSVYLVGCTGAMHMKDLLFPEIGECERNIQHPLDKKYLSLSREISDVIEDFNLVSFLPLSVEDKELMLRLISQCDKANGYVFVDASEYGGEVENSWKFPDSEDNQFCEEYYASLHEKYVDGFAYECACCRKPIEFSDEKQILNCSRCELANYCSEDCRFLHWKKSHNFQCKKKMDLASSL